MKLFLNHDQSRDSSIMLVDITNDIITRHFFVKSCLPAGRKTSLCCLSLSPRLGFVVGDETGEKCHPGGICRNELLNAA